MWQTGFAWSHTVRHSRESADQDKLHFRLNKPSGQFAQVLHPVLMAA
jgi:hypothetical protein